MLAAGCDSDCQQWMSSGSCNFGSVRGTGAEYNHFIPHASGVGPDIGGNTTDVICSTLMSCVQTEWASRTCEGLAGSASCSPTSNPMDVCTFCGVDRLTFGNAVDYSCPTCPDLLARGDFTMFLSSDHAGDTFAAVCVACTLAVAVAFAVRRT
jgi:hypothetical protein